MKDKKKPMGKEANISKKAFFSLLRKAVSISPSSPKQPVKAKR